MSRAIKACYPQTPRSLQVKNSEEALQADENTMIKGRQALLADYISQKEREIRQIFMFGKQIKCHLLTEEPKKCNEQTRKHPVNTVTCNNSLQGVEKGPDSVADEAEANLASHLT